MKNKELIYSIENLIERLADLKGDLELNTYVSKINTETEIKALIKDFKKEFKLFEN